MAKRRYINEIGMSGLNWSYGYIYQEFLTGLRGRSGIKTFKEMSDNDPIVGSCLFALKQILRSARWTAKPAEEGNAQSEKDAEFLRSCMFNMEHGWNYTVMEILSMLVYGWSWHEIVYERRDDGRVGWKKIPIRLQTSLDRWEMDESNGTILGMWQRPAPKFLDIYIPLWKSLLFRTELAGDNPEGRSVLRIAYVPWYYKKNIQEIEGIGIERELAGMPVLKPPEDFDFFADTPEVQSAKAYARQTLANIRRDEQDGLFLPPKWEFELVSSAGSRQINTSETINRYNKEIAVTVLAQFIMLGMERTGSYALAEEQIDMFYVCIDGWMDGIADTFNRYAVPKLFALNGISGRPLPYITHTITRRYKLRDLSQYVSQLANVNALEITGDLRDVLKKYARLDEYKEVSR